MSPDADHSHHDHGHHDHGQHHHGHANDQGLRGALRYLKHAPDMWRSEINDAVVDLIDLQSNESAIDVGAGMGAGIRRAAATGATVHAVEPTPFLRQILRWRAATEFRGRDVSVIDGTAENLVVADASTDAIYAVNTMHHWVDQGDAAAEIARVLAPGGRVVLVDEDFGDPSHPDHETFGGHSVEDHGFHTVDPAAMETLLRNVGLTDIEAGTRRLADRPTLAVLARKPPTG